MPSTRVYPFCMIRIGSIVLGVEDLPRAINFWQQAIDYVPREVPDDDRWQVMVPRNGNGSQLALMRSETPVQSHPRVHLDLYATDLTSEMERLLTLGATEVDWDSYGPDADFVVLADPDGNRFCIIEKDPAWRGFEEN
ncbi:glyoxalase-like domain protein [mine drainage metagenome]|uniref:Glyoxalase-like domain protein n=1 Tax=mine drainage metagenome TaxID=410659 RepID=A0A1J5QAX2_9ZZZZ